ncbi:MAG: hypothetical protein JWQ01_805 [Massilia sp.]|nr:hypothetical protein [Massilia sp.]
MPAPQFQGRRRILCALLVPLAPTVLNAPISYKAITTETLLLIPALWSDPEEI